MELSQALDELAAYIGRSKEFLYEYALEDKIGGYHPDDTISQWPCGSIFGVEGQFIYAAVRALRPSYCVEIGTYHGCSATHISSALGRNGHGFLTCVDPGAIFDPSGERVELVSKSIFDWEPTQTIKFIFEDGPHSREFTRDALIHLRSFISTDCLILVHDYHHFVVGKDVSASFDEFLDRKADSVLIHPSDCGLGYHMMDKP